MEYAKSLTELDEVLKYLDVSDLSKIPIEIRESIKNEKDKEYKWEYDESKSLNEQNLSRKTIAMLSYLNMEYLINEEQKELMKKIHEVNERKSEKEKSLKYSNKDLFDEKKVNKSESTNMLIETKSGKWYQKIKLFIKNLIKKK